MKYLKYNRAAEDIRNAFTPTACLTDCVLYSEVIKALSKIAYELSLKWMNNYSSITNFIMTELSLITAIFIRHWGTLKLR